MTRTVRLAALVLGSAVLANAPLSASHPFVAGFERFHSGPDADFASGGRLLLGELNCASCHAADGEAKKQAPVLDGIGGRARIGHLRKYIADPQAVKPGTTMPDLFAGDPEKDAKVEALVQFLANSGTLKQTRPDLRATLRGRDTALSGCRRHGPRDPLRNRRSSRLASSRLRREGQGHGSGTGRFANPLQALRPACRTCSPNEATDAAKYLLQGSSSTSRPVRARPRISISKADETPGLQTKPKLRGLQSPSRLDGQGGVALRFRFAVTSRPMQRACTRFISERRRQSATVDGKKVVDNGIHATETKSGRSSDKGVHKVIVDFQGGEATSMWLRDGLVRQSPPLVAWRQKRSWTRSRNRRT